MKKNLFLIVCFNDAEGDQFVLDMSQYESGMYMVRVSTENGTIVKRVNVVK